jgi:hypothetical protein
MAPGDDLAKLRRRSAGPDARGPRTPQFAEGLALADAVADIEIGPRQRPGLDLVLVVGVRAHGGDVKSRVQPVGHQHRLSGGRRRDDELRLPHQGFGIGRHPCLDPEAAREVGGTGGRLFRVPAMNQNPRKRPHEMRGLDLQPGLKPRSDHARGPHLGGGQMPCRDRARGGRADIGEIAIVQKHRLDQPGLRREQHHQSAQAGQAEVRVAENPVLTLSAKLSKPGI